MSAGYVNDFEEIFTTKQIAKLEKIIIDYEKKTHREIVVITVSTVEPYDDIKEFVAALSYRLGVEKPIKDDGLTMVLCTTSKNIRMATGPETEKILTKEVRKRVMDEVITPEFKNENYYVGIRKGLLELINKWQ